MITVRPKHLFGCLLALLLIGVRTADVHAHLCRDGKEPRAALHLADGGSHPCQTDAATEHSGDKDMQIAADLLLKKSSVVDHWLLPLQAFAFEYAIPRSEKHIDVGALEPRFDTPARLRPPLRGPPV